MHINRTVESVQYVKVLFVWMFPSYDAGLDKLFENEYFRNIVLNV